MKGTWLGATQADEATQRAEAQQKLVTLRHDLSAARAEAQRERRGGEEALAAARTDAEQVTAQLLSDLERTNGVLRATRDALVRGPDTVSVHGEAWVRHAM